MRSAPKVESLIGREDDRIRSSNGRPIILLDVIFEDIDGLIEAQFVQDAIDELRIVAVTSPNFDLDQERKVIARARERLGEHFRIRFERVDAIARAASGKFRGVVCNVR